LTKHVKKIHEERPDGEVKKMPRQRKRNGGGAISQEQHTVTIMPKSAENQNNVIIIVKKSGTNTSGVPEGTPNDRSSYQPSPTLSMDPPEPTVHPQPSANVIKKKKTSLPFEYACKTCPFRAPSVSKFSAHLTNGHCRASLNPMKSKHSKLKEREFKCTQCDAEFFREDSLRCHRIQHDLHVSNNVTTVPEAS